MSSAPPWSHAARDASWPQRYAPEAVRSANPSPSPADAGRVLRTDGEDQPGDRAEGAKIKSFEDGEQP